MRDVDQRDKLNAILTGATGQGPLPWSHYRDAFCGRGKRSSAFTNLFMSYIEKWPDRFKVRRPYNVSESPIVEVLNG